MEELLLPESTDNSITEAKNDHLKYVSNISETIPLRALHMESCDPGSTRAGASPTEGTGMASPADPASPSLADTPDKQHGTHTDVISTSIRQSLSLHPASGYEPKDSGGDVGPPLTLMQQMREQLRRSRQDASDQGSEEERPSSLPSRTYSHAGSEGLAQEDLASRDAPGTAQLPALDASASTQASALHTDFAGAAKSSDAPTVLNTRHSTPSHAPALLLSQQPNQQPPMQDPQQLELPPSQQQAVLPPPVQQLHLPAQPPTRPLEARCASPGSNTPPIHSSSSSGRKVPPGKGPTRKPSPGRLAQNLALFAPPGQHAVFPCDGQQQQQALEAGEGDHSIEATQPALHPNQRQQLRHEGSPGGGPMVAQAKPKGTRSPGRPTATRSPGRPAGTRSPGRAAAAEEGATEGEGPQLYVAPGSPGAGRARGRLQAGPRPRDWNKSVQLQPEPPSKVRFINELQLAEMLSVRLAAGADADRKKGGRPPPKSLKEPPDELEEKLQMMYYREVAARQRQEWRLGKQRQEYEEAQLQGCTFMPSISKMSAWITRHNSPAGRVSLSEGRTLGSPGRGFTSPRQVSPSKSHRASSVSASAHSTPQKGLQQLSKSQGRPSQTMSETDDAHQSVSSISSSVQAEREAVFERLYHDAALLEQRRRQRLEEEIKEERESHVYRARSPGHNSIAASIQELKSNHYMTAKVGPRHNLLPSGLEECTFHPQTNFVRHVHANPRPNPEAEELKAFDDDEFFSAALGLGVPLSPAKLAAARGQPTSPNLLSKSTSGAKLGRPGRPGGSNMSAQMRLSDWDTNGSPNSKVAAGLSLATSMTNVEEKGLAGVRSAAPNAVHSISDRLDWDEFLSRQYAFLSQQLIHNMSEADAPPYPPKPILSAGSAKIIQKKEQEGAHYVPPSQRPLSPGRGDAGLMDRPQDKAAYVFCSTSGQSAAAPDYQLVSHKTIIEEPSYIPYVTAMAAKMPHRTAAEFMEGGRALREAKLAELRRQLEEKEKEATPFKPTIFSKKYSGVMPHISRHNPGQHLAVYAQQKLALEQRRIQVQAEREAAEMAECTFHPRTNPLPAYLWKAHQWEFEQLAGPDQYSLGHGGSEAMEGMMEGLDGEAWPGGPSSSISPEDAASGSGQGCPGGGIEGEEVSWYPAGDEAGEGHGPGSASMASCMSNFHVAGGPGWDPGQQQQFMQQEQQRHVHHHQLFLQQQQQQQQQLASRSDAHTPKVGSRSAHGVHGAGGSDSARLSGARGTRGLHQGDTRPMHLSVPEGYEEYLADADAFVSVGGYTQPPFGPAKDVHRHENWQQGMLYEQQRQQQQGQHHHQPGLEVLGELLEVGPGQTYSSSGDNVSPAMPDQQQGYASQHPDSYLALPAEYENVGYMPSPAPASYPSTSASAYREGAAAMSPTISQPPLPTYDNTAPSRHQSFAGSDGLQPRPAASMEAATAAVASNESSESAIHPTPTFGQHSFKFPSNMSSKEEVPSLPADQHQKQQYEQQEGSRGHYALSSQDQQPGITFDPQPAVQLHMDVAVRADSSDLSDKSSHVREPHLQPLGPIPMPTSNLDDYKQQLAEMQLQLLGG